MTSPTPGMASTGCGTLPPASAVTWPHVLLTALVIVFTGWLITRGFDWYMALLIASGCVAVGSGLTYVPRGLTRVARALVQQP